MTTVATTMMHVRVPKALRDDAKEAASSLGISMSLIVEQALRNFAATKQLVVEKPLVPTPYLENILKEAEQNKDNPDFFSGPLTKGEFIEYLKSL